jgi:hypothetical protein
MSRACRASQALIELTSPPNESGLSSESSLIELSSRASSSESILAHLLIERAYTVTNRAE